MDENVLVEIFARLKRLEDVVFRAVPVVSKSAPQRESKKANKDTLIKGLPSHILELRDEGFFQNPQTAAEVHGALQSRYPCEPDRVTMALLRLQRRKELRKSSKVVGEKKIVAYVW